MTTGNRPNDDSANPLEQVRQIRLSSPLLDPPEPPDRPDPRPRAHLSQAGPARVALTRLRPRLVFASVAALAILAGVLLDATVAFTVVLLGLLGAAIGVLAPVVNGFGAGFVGYRPDDGWPHGVQEQYDVKFHFR